MPAPDAVTDRRSAMGIVALLVVLALSIVPFLIYHWVRTSAEVRQAAIAVTGGDPANAAAIAARYGCGGCHVMPGIDGATGLVGPDLSGLSQRLYVAGVVPNTPTNLIAFIVDPQKIDDKSAMPRTGITEAEARDIAAYIYAMR